MKNYYAKFAIKGILSMAAALAFTFTLALPTQAQYRAPGPETTPANALGMSDRDRNLLDRETQLSMIEKERRKAIKRDPQLAMAQIKDDFRHIQLVNRDMMRAVQSGSVLDYKVISEAASEIKKRAARLKTNLVFPEAEKTGERQKSQDPEANGLPPSLMALDNLIYSFVTNPVFRETGVVDTKLGSKARDDLERIIELSDKVRKSAERMSKNARK